MLRNLVDVISCALNNVYNKLLLIMRVRNGRKFYFIKYIVAMFLSRMCLSRVKVLICSLLKLITT